MSVSEFNGAGGDGNGDSITDASQANCDGGSSCRWRNVDTCGSEELQWAQGEGSADPQRWQLATGVNQQPCKLQVGNK